MPKKRLDRVIDLIYEAAIEPDAWNDVVVELSRLFDGAAVLLGTSEPTLQSNYVYRLDEEYAAGYTEHLLNGLPWKSAYTKGFTERFGCMAEVFPDIEFAESGFYQTWCKPQHLAPIWPIGHTIVVEGSVAVGGMGIYRREGPDARPFTAGDLALGDQLVRHFARAFVIHAAVGGVRRERVALAEVMDRLPTGVILLDARRQPVVTNVSADRIIGLDDGFRVGAGGPHASDARENAILQKLVADVLEAAPGEEIQSTGVLSVSRPSGKRAFPVMVTKLLAAPPGSRVRDAVAAIFISDPDSGLVSATEVLQSIYSLTHSEAELVRLLSQGKSLEEAAEARGVAINTARSHLKRVFSKTDTRRQGELVRLVLTGVASLAEE